MKKFYTVKEDSDRVYPLQLEDVNSFEYVFEVIQTAKGEHTYGWYEINLYQNGVPTDWTLNGWTFSKNISGRYKYFDTFSRRESTNYAIDTYSQVSEKLKMEYNNEIEYLDPEKLVLAIYKHMLIVSSLCRFKEDYIEMKDLFNKRLPPYSISGVAEALQEINRLEKWINTKGHEKEERKLAIKILNEKMKVIASVLEKVEIK